MHHDDVSTLFAPIVPNLDQAERVERLRGKATAFAHALIRECGHSPLQTLAIRRAHEAFMLAELAVLKSPRTEESPIKDREELFERVCPLIPSSAARELATLLGLSVMLEPIDGEATQAAN